MNKDYFKREEFLTNLEYELVKDFIQKRKDKHISQMELAKNSQVIRQTINRIENCLTSPQINTMIKLLEPLGYTLKIVPLDKEE